MNISDFSIYGRCGPGALDSLNILSRDVGTYSTPGKAIPRTFEKSIFWASPEVPWGVPGGVLPGIPANSSVIGHFS